MTQARDNGQTNDVLANLAQPARRALLAAGCASLDQVAHLTEADLRRLHGVGPKAIAQLRAALAARGLSFRE